MDYWTTDQAAEAWGVFPQRVRLMCAAGRVPGAEYRVVKGRAEWSIPAGTPRPKKHKSGPKPKERGE